MSVRIIRHSLGHEDSYRWINISRKGYSIIIVEETEVEHEDIEQVIIGGVNDMMPIIM